MQPIDAIPLAAIRAARTRIAGAAIRSPLVRLETEGATGEIYLKLENLQPIGSFKVRGAYNAMIQAGPERLADGVHTASAGNMAQGIAWSARRLGVACQVVVPEHAPRAKLDAVERMGARTVRVPFDDWWEIIQTQRSPGLAGLFIHPVCDPAVIAGNGTIGLEILEELPDVDTIVAPYGGGGLASGIAAAMRSLSPEVRVYAAEVATAAPLAASLAAGSPRQIAYTPSFVDGIGGKSLLEPMWPLVRDLLEGSRVVELAEVAAAIRLLAARCQVIAEGAGAVPVAAALRGRLGDKVACVVSGGNIDAATLATILEGGDP